LSEKAKPQGIEGRKATDPIILLYFLFRMAGLPKEEATRFFLYMGGDKNEKTETGRTD
jgi:hypothetical protein